MCRLVLLAAACLPLTAHALDADLSGQVNKLLIGYNDGRDTDVVVTDNFASTSRFGFRASQTLDNGLTASLRLLAELPSNSSNAFSQNTAAGQSSTPVASTPATFRDRLSQVGLAGDWGAVFVGRIEHAAEEVAEQDVTGAHDILFNRITDLGGALAFRTSTGALNTLNGGSAVRLRDVGQNYDGDRREGIAYHSPVWKGTQLRVSTEQGGDVDTALFYTRTTDIWDIAAAVGYVSLNEGNTAAVHADGQLSGSMSARHHSGWGGTLGYGTRQLQGAPSAKDDPTYSYAKVGYSWDRFELAADMAQGNDQIITDTTNHELTAFGVGAQWKLAKGVSLLAAARNYSLDYGTANLDDIQVYALGMLVKF
jgi:predicted porin